MGFYQQNRSLLLLLLSAFLLILAYVAGVKKTLEAYSEVATLQEQVALLDNIDSRVAEARGMLSEVAVKGFASEAEKNSYLIDSLMAMERVAPFSLEEIAPGSFTKKDTPPVEFLAVTLKGSYTGMLKALMFFERSKGLGVVTSVSFFSKEDQKTKKVALFCRIVLLNVKG